MKQHLIICSRYPQAGRSKTRLIPYIGAQQAALLQKRMTEKLLVEADTLYHRTQIPSSLFYSDGSPFLMQEWLGKRHFVEQHDGDLGQRMEHAFRYMFSLGYSRIILVGSDIPALNTHLLESAFNTLENHDTVLGPTEDGGYYLIGIKKDAFPHLSKALFHNIPWSTKTVFSLSSMQIREAGYSLTCLPTLRDIDHYSDLLYAQEQGHI